MYLPLDSDPTDKFYTDIRPVIQSMIDGEIIDDDTFQFINVSNARAVGFYMIPKIHQPDIPGRSICSSNNHPTENISHFVGFHIYKYVTNLPSYVRDTLNFKNTTEGAG